MAAQHLSAVLIQKRIRGMLCRDRLQNNSLLFLQALNKPKSHRIISPMQRFITSGGGSFDDDAGFRHFTATYLQAWYKKEQQRWRFMLERFAVYHIAALQIQYAWRMRSAQQNHYHKKARVVPLRVRAALCLQMAWRSYTNRRIYRYYRDLITFENTGDPALMLRAINPGEASLLDAAMGAHVRFRLGGMSFPPTIYYKIFTRRAICDLNAFSPKDYTIQRQTAPGKVHTRNGKNSKAQTLFIRVGNSYYRTKQAEYDTHNWYKRMENNGWRPVTAKVIADATSDPICQATSKKTLRAFHYSHAVRKQDREKQRKLKKRLWMQKLYTQGLLKETAGSSSEDTDKSQEEAERLLFDVDFDDEEQWEEEAEAMFQWASGLDYDEYVDNWQVLGKTTSTDE